MVEEVSTERLAGDGFSGIAGRVEAISRNTIREALRQRFVPFTILFAIALVIGLSRLRELTFGASELRFIVDLGFGAIDLFGSVLTIALAAQLFFNELEHRTVFTLLAKPVSRGEFLLGKFLGVAQVGSGFCALLGVVIAAMLHLRAGELSRLGSPAETPLSVSIDYAALSAALVAQGLKLWIVTATTLLVASFARTQFFTLGTSLLLWVIGHLQDFAQTAAAHGSSAGKVAWQFTLLAGPNFRLFDFSETVTREAIFSTAEWLRVGLYGGAYVVLFLAAAIWFFRGREL